MPGIKPGALNLLPPSTQEWKAQGGKGEPPLPFEKVIKSTPSNDALEYLIFHAFVQEVTPRELERRIYGLEHDTSRKNQRYNKAAAFYLKKKLEEIILKGS